jgi:putative lipase involved disintegration of autophagic bodies
LGKSIVYDTVQKLGWHVDLRKHVIKEVILEVLDLQDGWPDEDGNEWDVPVAHEEEDCVVSDLRVLS